MKKSFFIIGALAMAITAKAQTLNLAVGEVTYHFPAAQVGDMTFASGTSLTIMGKEFNVDDVTRAYIDDSEISGNEVNVTYNGSSATVSVPGNVAKYVDITVSGAHVSIAQSSEVDNNNVGEITYVLSGDTPDGEFFLSGQYKSTVELNGVTIVNMTPVFSGAALNVQNGKRIDVVSKNGTVNYLTDCAEGDQKACLVIKGHGEFKGKGTLNINGLLNHGIKTGEYMTVKNCTINVLTAKGDGIHCNEYFMMESGSVNVSGIDDDGIQAEIDGDVSTGETPDHEDEDSGNIYINGGTINISVTEAATKGIKADGDINVTGGDITVSTSGGGFWDYSNTKVKAPSCLSCDGNTSITGGKLTLNSSGAGGKGMSGNGSLTVTGGDINITTTGGMTVYVTRHIYDNYTGNTDRLASNYKSAPKGMKFDGDINISGGNINVSSAKHEGIESKGVLTIEGGYIESVCSDDALNSGSHMYIKGGYVYAASSNNDAIDSNGNMYLSGGHIFAGGREEGFDANSERGYKLYVQNGVSFIAIGPGMGALEGGANISQTCYQYSPGEAGTTYGLYSGSNQAFAVTLPAISGGGPGGPGGGGPGGGSSDVKIVCTAPSTPELYSDVTGNGTALWSGKGHTSFEGGSQLTLSTYTNEGGGWPW